LVWTLIALWTGFTFAGYFTPIDTLGSGLLAGSLGFWQWFWMFFYAFFTLLQAGFMREQVCKYMCPYARFQSAMFDRDTLIVSYDSTRGESRGKRSRHEDYKASGKGDCIDCGVCVEVCPTGIDIRDGLQYECIGCGLCADGCNQIMTKMQYPQGLIRYTTLNALDGKVAETSIRKRFVRPRVLVYATILTVITLTVLTSLMLRSPLQVNVIRDRGALAREVEGQYIENVYRLQITNKSHELRHLVIRSAGIDGMTTAGDIRIAVDPSAYATAIVDLRIPIAIAEAMPPGAHKISISVQSEDDPRLVVTQKATFFVPR
jgi:cytochrome c oxidase accessory protein FixG